MENYKNDEGLTISVGCKAILRKMLNQRIIGGKHLPERICLSWIKNQSKKDHKRTIKDRNNCINKGLVLTKPKQTGIHVSLNPRRIEEILRMVE